MFLQYFERLMQTQMSFLNNDKKLDCKTRKLNVNKKDEIQRKNKMLQTRTEKVANKIYHIVPNKLLQTKKVLQTTRRCKLKNVDALQT